MTDLPALTAAAFPAGTPLHAFFAWNEAGRGPDRRYVVAQDLHLLRRHFGPEGRKAGLVHLLVRPLIDARAPTRFHELDAAALAALDGTPELAAGEAVIDALQASLGSADMAAHADLFQAFERLDALIDLTALAGTRPIHRRRAPRPGPRRILVIKLSALGDFVQALGPMQAIRRHHADDRLSLLTTAPYAEFARAAGLFDEVLIDRRPGFLDIPGWLALRRTLGSGRFDRVYDLQTSDRSSLYALLLPWRNQPEWSGIARRCSHPHANLERDPQHTIDKQAEQLLMAGIFPTPLPSFSGATRTLPEGLDGKRFALLIPGSSPRHPAKRWPAEHYGALAQKLAAQGLLPVVLGGRGEEALGDRIRALCPSAIDLVGKTDLAALADLARAATLSVGNDTGATHIAAAGGHPVIVLFSAASEPLRCAPRGQVRVLSRPSLADLTVAEVLAAALETMPALTS
ncbi:MAG TPA: glycosyltransferase family 9 protein [Aliidongia sp.]|nr:glycosyltransferase family 9 protein [Aliidongia sp.]